MLYHTYSSILLALCCWTFLYIIFQRYVTGLSLHNFPEICYWTFDADYNVFSIVLISVIVQWQVYQLFSSSNKVSKQSIISTGIVLSSEQFLLLIFVSFNSIKVSCNFYLFATERIYLFWL
jgi:hypothetical protein